MLRGELRTPVHQLPLHPLLFGAYFVLFLYAENLQLVRLTEVSSPLAWTLIGSALLLAGAGLLTIGVSWLLARISPGLIGRFVAGGWVRGGLIASALVVAFMAYGHVVELAGEDVPEEALIGGWGVLIFGASALALFRHTPVGTLNGGLNIVAGVLLAFALSSIVPHNLQAPARAQSDSDAPTGLVAERTTQRDIFYLVFDRYGSQGSLEAGFGITDNDLPAWLAERGFTVVPDAHANSLRTTLSLASVLNLEYLDDVAARMGPQSIDHGPVHNMLHEQLVGRFLREQGYRYVHIGSWFNPTRSIRAADESIEYDSATEFEVVLHDTTAMPLLDEHFGAEEQARPATDEAHMEHALFQLRAMNRVLADPGPKFVVAHVLLPHDPYVFDEQGNYVPVAERADEPIPSQYRRQLEFTNNQIKAYVERLLARPPSEQPIIIIQADEGPYPDRYAKDQFGFDWSTATPAELETKFGVISALYLPPEPGQPADLPEPYPTMSSVNTFRLVLARYFGLDLPFLPDRSYTSRGPRLVYDMTDITDRLPADQ